MELNFSINIDFDNLLVVVMTAFSIGIAALTLFFARRSDKTATRTFEQGQPELVEKNYGEPKDGVVTTYLWFVHGLPGTVSVRRKKMPWRMESDYDGAANATAVHRHQLRLKIPADKKDNARFHLKYKSNGQYVLVVKW